jgi:hypothetical protein
MSRARTLLLGLAAAVAGGGCPGQTKPAPQGKSSAGGFAPGFVPDPTPSADEGQQNTLAALLTVATTPEAVVTLLKPSMKQENLNVHNDGSQLFAWWGAEHTQTIFDSDRATETSFALVRKDADEELGRRMCAAGMIVEIHKEVFSGRKFFWGLLVARGGTSNLVSFWAVGSTGRLVENSWAGFCGFVTGTYDYSNSSGGTGHAVEVVGHFLLPENRASPVTHRSTAITTSDVPGATPGGVRVQAALRKRPNRAPGMSGAGDWGEPLQRGTTSKPPAGASEDEDDDDDRPKASARSEPKEPAFVDPFK